MNAYNFNTLKDKIKKTNSNCVLIYTAKGNVDAVTIEDFHKPLVDEINELKTQANNLKNENEKLRMALIDLVKAVKEIALKNSITEADLANLTNFKKGEKIE